MPGFALRDLIDLSSLHPRGLFVRHCFPSDFKDAVDLEFYDYENNLITSSLTDYGFIKDKSDSSCKVLNIRGVKLVTSRIKNMDTSTDITF